MWARIESNNIVEYYDRKQSIVLNNVRYSSQIFTIWTDTQRKDLGIVPVVISGSHLNTNYYIEHNHSDAIAGDGNSVIRTIGVKAADKALADVNEVWTQSEIDNGDAPDGTSANDPKNDADGNQIVTLGLKSNAKRKAATDADSLLNGFNWLIARKVTADTAVPSAVVSYMAAVRTAHASICTAIDNASDMDAFIVLHTDELNEDKSLKTVAKVNDWPDDSGVKGNRR